MRLLKLLCVLLLGSVAASQAVARDASVASAADAILEHQRDARVLVIGELHGTVQTPALLAELARRLARRGEVQVALEIPLQEQARLDAFLRSDGGASARAVLLQGPFWQRPRERSDGRRSVAMLDLLDALRGLQSDEPATGVIAFDPGATLAGVDRDAALAAQLRAAFARRPEAVLLVLTGNYHARLRAPQGATFAGKPITPPPPMAGHLVDLPMMTIDIGARRGAFWGCGPACGPTPIRHPHAGGDAIDVERLERAHHDYDLRIRLPQLDPSPPVDPSAVPAPR